MPAPVLPDVEALTVAYLKAHTALTAALAGAQVATDVPNNVGTAGALTVNRIGGTPRASNWLDRADIDINAWGTSRAHASLLIRTAVAALLDMRQHVSVRGVVTGVDVLLGPSWLPDDSRTPAIPRYLASCAVYAHP